MTTAVEVLVLFKGDTSDLKGAASGAKSIVGGVLDSLGKIGLAGLGLGSIKDVVGGVAGSVGELIGASEALGDAGARVGAVWGDTVAGYITDHAELANSLGMTKTAYLDQVGALGQLATSLGVGQEAARGIAQGFTELAPKLAAYAGVEGSVASDALEKALMGKTKGLAALGIAINDADLKQAALGLGITSQANKWTEAQLAQVEYAAVLAKTGAAQDAWAGNSGDVEVSLQRVSSAITDAKTALGDKLLPIIAPLAQGFASMLPDAIDTAMAVMGPAFDTMTSLGERFSSVLQVNLGDGTNLATSALRALSGVLGDMGLGPVADAFWGLGQAVLGIVDTWQTASDASSSLGEQIQIFIELMTGFDIDPLVSGLQSLVDTGAGVIGWIDETIGISNILLPIIGVALVLAFGSLAVAAGSAALGVITALAPVVVPIALIGTVLAVLRAAWDNDWGGIQEKVAGVVAWIQSNLLPPIQAAFGGIQALLSTLVGWWQQNGDQIIGVVSGIVGFVTTQFGFLFNILSGIVQAGIALITGNWSGLGTALGSILANGINLIVGLVRGLLTSIGNILGGLRSLMSNLVKGALDSLVSLFKGGSRDSSKSLIDGLIDGIKSGAGRAVSAIVDLGKNLVSSFMANLKIASPSQVFAELGAWITLGLASGIQKEDRKAVEALSAVISSMNSAIGGMQDFASKILKFVVPSDTQVSEAREKFTSLLLIVQGFVKDFAYLGALLPVSNISQASDAQRGLIDAVVRSKFGVGVEDLITGGEASWASALVDIISKVAGAWGAIADNLTKMQAAKMPTDSQLDALKAAAVGVILWAQEVTNGAPPNPVGVSDFGEVVKTASDMLANVAKLNIDKVTALAADKLDVAASNAHAIALSVGLLASAFVGQAGTAEQRAEFVKGVSDYAGFVKSASDILAAGATDKLSEVTALEADRLAVAASNGSLMIDAVAGLVFAFKGAGGSEEQRAALITSVRQYADLVKGAGDILAAGAALALADATDVDLIQLDIASTNAAEMFRSVVLLSTDFRAMADEAQSALADGAKRYAEVVKAAADVLGAGAGLALASAVDVDLVQLDIAEANAKEMESSITMLSETFRRLAEDAQKDLAEGAKRYADVVKAAADVLGLGAALDLRDAVMFEWNLLPFIEETVVAIYDSVVRLSEKFRAMGGEEQTNLASGAKLYADIIKAAADVLKAGSSVDLRDAVSFEWNMMGFVEEAVTAIFDSVVRLSEKFRSDNNTEAQKAIVEGAKNYASVVTAAASLFGSVAGSIDKLADIGNPGDLTTKLDTVRGWITILWDQLALIATDITKDEAEAKAAVASAIGTAAKGLGDIGDGISKLLAMETGGLLGADPNRSDLGFMQRVKGRRADFNASVLTDSIKRMVKSLTDALGTLDLPDPKDPKIEALSALGDAFGKLADGVTKLAQAKIPDAKQLEALASVTARAGSLIPAGPALSVAGAGSGGGTTVINQNTINGNVNIIATDKDSLGGIVSSLGSWGRRP